MLKPHTREELYEELHREAGPVYGDSFITDPADLAGGELKGGDRAQSTTGASGLGGRPSSQ